MMDEHTICVVIPARNEEDHIQRVLETLPVFVDHAVVIDDGSIDSTYERATSATSSADVQVLKTEGIGVGGAIDLGHQHVLNKVKQPFVSVVMAGDGQMDPDDLHKVVQPIVNGIADHVKGNRMSNARDIEQMPKGRRRASKVLGWLTTLASGRKTNDPQCGYTATSSELLQSWDWNRSWSGYGYPNYWLIRLSSEGRRVVDVPVKAVYADEQSGIRPMNFFLRVGWMMTIEHHRRAFHHLFKSPIMMLSFIFYVAGYLSIGMSFTQPLSILALLPCWWIAHRLDRNAMHRLSGGRTKI